MQDDARTLPPVAYGIMAIVLAAGKASRMGSGGSHKLLAEFDGVPLVRRTAQAVLDSKVGPVVVVTGHRAPEIATALENMPLRLRHNPDFGTGMASSLIVGVTQALSSDAAAAMIVLADMPHVTSAHLVRMVEIFRKQGGPSIVRAQGAGRRGNPVILPRSLFGDILQLRGDVGARDIIEASRLPVIPVDIGSAGSIDVNTPADIVAAGGIVRS